LRPTRSRIEKLTAILRASPRFLVLTHDNPDPDSIAAAWLLGRIARRAGCPRVTLGYGGIIGRTENRAMLEVLRIPLRPISELDVERFDSIGLVDTQPRTGNNSLPVDRIPRVVFDHHPLRAQTRRVPFREVHEEYGATATMLFEYLHAMGIQPDQRLATAVFHAIRSETQNLGREAGRRDARAFLQTFPFIDNKALSRIEHARLPREWFAMLGSAIAGTRIYGDLAVALLGNVHHPDMVAQFADLIVRLDGIDWALAIGRHRSDILLSIRTNRRRANAGAVIRSIVGKEGSAGGHDMIAGGKLAGAGRTRRGARRFEDLLIRRLLTEINLSGIRPVHLTLPAH
jgi:nanoRNase/pAp phosphatase (c-di-AMP/oligoRNAs hydrolase)